GTPCCNSCSCPRHPPTKRASGDRPTTPGESKKRQAAQRCAILLARSWACSIGQWLAARFRTPPNEGHSEEIDQRNGCARSRIAAAEITHNCSHLPDTDRGENPTEIERKTL